MKKMALAFMASVALMAPVAIAAPAQAGEGYVTRKEFKKVKVEWSLPRVHRVFDTRGQQSWYYSGSPEYCSHADLWACPTQSREYRTKSRWGTVYVDYVKYPSGVWRLESKSAYW